MRIREKIGASLAGALLAGFAVAPGTAIAAPIYGTTAALSGSISDSTSTILEGGNSFTSSLSWIITAISGGFHYKYTLDTNDTAGISRFVVDLSDNCISGTSLTDAGCVANVTLNGVTTGYTTAYGTFTSSTNANSNMPNSILGVEWITTASAFTGSTPGGDLVVEFDSNRAPVWGDVYFKADGGGTGAYQGWNVAQNTATCAGLDSSATTCTDSDTTHFIARPDGLASVSVTAAAAAPEPMTVSLLGLALVGFSFANRLRRRE